jgi:SNF2 family DNA or RNA helicase
MPHAELVAGEILVQTHWNESELIGQVPGIRWHEERRVWRCPVNWTACIQLRGIFGDKLTVGQSLAQWSQDEYKDRIERSLELRDLVSLGWEVGNKDHLFAKLFPFQVVGVEWMMTTQHGLLADEMGGGKTIQALTVLESLGAQAFPALVICPNSVKFNWASEAAVWAPSAHPYVVDGSATERRRIIEKAAGDPFALVVINLEATRTLSKLAGYGSQALRRCVSCGGKDPKIKSTACEAHVKELNRIGWRTVICDEAHRIKDPNAKQTRAVWALGQQTTVTRRYALTGTPLANNPSDLWSIMHFVDHIEYPVKSKFIGRYCLAAYGTYGGLEIKGLHPDTKAEFYKFFDPRFRRMPKALVLQQLPPKQQSTRYVELAPKQAKAYKAFEKEYAAYLPDGSLLIAPNDLEARLRLLQLSSAALEETPDGWRMHDPSPKVDEVLAILEEMGDRPLAVAAYHKQLINLLAARLDKEKISYGLVTGDQKPFERELAIRDFQAGKLRVLAFTMATGGTGITLTAANTIVRMQRSWSMIDNKQTEDRVHRIGSEVHDSVHVIDIVSRETVEEQQLITLLEKSMRLEEIARDKAKLQAAGLDTSHLDILEATIMSSDLAGAGQALQADRD